MVARGADVWTSLLRATRNCASRFRSPVSNAGRTTPVTSGPTSDGLLERSNRRSSSARTSRTTSTSDSEKSSLTWRNSDTLWKTIKENRTTSCRLLEQLALRTSAEESSSWPTATATDAKSSGAANYSTESGRHPGTTLTDAAKLWPTPRASANENRTTRPAPPHGKGHGRVLAGEAAAWATPRANERGQGNSADSHVALSLQVQQTPTDGEGGSTQEDRRQLCPSFVERLMGFPLGWSTARIGSVSSEMR